MNCFFLYKKVSYAKDSDAFSSFAVTCDQTARYKLSLLLPAARGLAEAHTASLKTNRFFHYSCFVGFVVIFCKKKKK